MKAINIQMVFKTLAGLLGAATVASVVALASAAALRFSGWEGVASELLLVFVLGLEGLIAYGAFFRDEKVTAQERRQRTLEFYGRFYDPFWKQAAQVVWRLRDQWNAGDHACLEFFFITGTKAGEPQEPNGLTAHQNLSVVLHHWAELNVCLGAGLLDEELVSRLLRHQFSWYEKFFIELIGEYENTRLQGRDAELPAPFWVAEIRTLADQLRQLKGAS